MQLADARQVAEEVVAALAPSCAQIEIAGSIRRQKPVVKDIEIVYIPLLEIRTVDLLGGTEQIRLDETLIQALIDIGFLAWDEETKRRGPKYKRVKHLGTGLVVELFAATRDNWGLILALRTGPADFNHLLVTREIFGGGMPSGSFMRDGYLWVVDPRDPSRPLCARTPTEAAFFSELGMPCWPPPERTVDRLRQHLAGGER